MTNVLDDISLFDVPLEQKETLTLFEKVKVLSASEVERRQRLAAALYEAHFFEKISLDVLASTVSRSRQTVKNLINEEKDRRQADLAGVADGAVSGLWVVDLDKMELGVREAIAPYLIRSAS